MAREDSQVFPRTGHEPAFAQALYEGIDVNWRKVQSLRAVWIVGDDELVAWQGLLSDDLAQIVCKVLER